MARDVQYTFRNLSSDKDYEEVVEFFKVSPVPYKQ